MKAYIDKLAVISIFLTLSIFSACAIASDRDWVGNQSSSSWDRQVKQKQALQELLRNYEDRWSKGYADEVAEFYTEDAIFFAPGAAPFVGHEDISALVQSLIDSGISEVSLIADEIEVNGRGRTAYIIGHYDLFVDGVSVGQGPFLLLMKSIKNEWKIYRDIFNSSQPQL